MGIYFEMFQAPFETTRQLLIGLFLGLASFLTFGLASFFILGFAGETMKKSINGDLKLPQWMDWKKIFITGVLVAIALAAYLLPGWLIIAIERFDLLVEIFMGFSSLDALQVMLVNVANAGFLVYFGLIIAFLGTLFAPMAVISVLETNQIGSVLNFKTIIKTSLRKSYAKAWLFVIIDFMILFAIANILSFASIFGTVLGIVLFFYIFSTTTALAFGNAMHEIKPSLMVS